MKEQRVKIFFQDDWEVNGCFWILPTIVYNNGENDLIKKVEVYWLKWIVGIELWPK